ncbi:MAG: hypothetical protein WD512_11085 [Candidatus Paceibacterota bacterium]
MVTGKKVSKKDWIVIVAKKLALKSNSMPSQKHFAKAELMAESEYLLYLKQYDKVKKSED